MIEIILMVLAAEFIGFAAFVWVLMCFSIAYSMRPDPPPGPMFTTAIVVGLLTFGGLVWWWM